MTIETYNPHALIELRDINDGVESFVTHKATDLEWKLEQAKYQNTQLAVATGKIESIKSEMNQHDWYSDSTSKTEVLDKLEEILSYQPTGTISITATIEVFLTAEVPLKDLADFDADAAVRDAISVDSSGWSDYTVDDWQIESADWEEQ